MAESTAAICDVYLCVSDVCPLLTLRDPPQIHLSNLNSYRRERDLDTQKQQQPLKKPSKNLLPFYG